MSRRRADLPARRRGSTLLELMVVVSIMGILSAIVVPSFQRAVEQSHVDQAAASLRTIWAAQRLYRLDHGGYACGEAALQTLRAEGLIAEIDDRWFRFSASEAGFPITAERRGSPVWTGAIEVTETGSVIGQVEGDGRVLAPAFIFGGG